MRLECNMIAVGWESELPPEQYAAWIKFLQAVKIYGQQGGRIKRAYISDSLLRFWQISRDAFDRMVSCAESGGALSSPDGVYYVVTDWSNKQIDATARERQARHRAKDVTASSVTANKGKGEDLVQPERSNGHVPFTEIRAAWNAMAGESLPNVIRMTKKRKSAIQSRWRDDDWKEHWSEALAKIPERPFLMGDNDRGWKADFDFFIKPDTVTKILEGKYAGSRRLTSMEARNVEPDYSKGF